MEVASAPGRTRGGQGNALARGGAGVQRAKDEAAGGAGEGGWRAEPGRGLRRRRRRRAGQEVEADPLPGLRPRRAALARLQRLSLTPRLSPTVAFLTYAYLIQNSEELEREGHMLRSVP